MTQNAVTVAMRVPLERERELEVLVRGRAPNAFRAIEALHFLSLFVVRAEGNEPPLLCLEASFDGPRRAFLERLVADGSASRAVLEAAFQFCDGCPVAGASVQAWCGYLDAGEIGTRVFYVASPGRRVQQIEAEAAFAARVAAIVRGLDDLQGRRAAIVRRVWDRLTPEDRDFAMQVPRRPFWERLRLLERPLGALYDLLAWPLFAIGLATFVLVAAQAAGSPVWPAVVLPREVVEAAAWWTLALLCFIALVAVAWFAQFVGEFPAELTASMRWNVIAVKAGEFFGATLRAVPGFAALLGIIAFAHWHARLLASLGLGLLAILVAATVLFVLTWVVRLVRIALREPLDRVNEMTWDAARLREVCRPENQGIQNHFVTVMPIRSGLLRLVTLEAVLWWIGRLEKYLHNPRGLLNTQSIHFARWTILPGRRLMFVSNYDGGFGGYLSMFATVGAFGVSAIWGNTEGFPRTFYLFGDGARDEQRFKCRARASQYETLLWYRRYPALSVAAIERNAQIREDLARFSRVPAGERIPEAELDAFLRRFSLARA